MQEALKNANVDPATIDFVEAHGIGNKFTDAMEIQAIQQSYGKREQPIYVGSVKPNIGHLEAAVGMAMLAKIIGSFQHHQIAPNIHFDTPNQDLDWNNIKVKVPTDTVNWNSANSDQPLRKQPSTFQVTAVQTFTMILKRQNQKLKVRMKAKQPVLGFNISSKNERSIRPKY
ncbi:MAG: hypothetical protein R2728_02310 [Chitinophagales bacterium]